MSRIAKNSINISDNVTCKYENGNFYAKGKLGEMTLSVDDLFKVEIKDREIKKKQDKKTSNIVFKNSSIIFKSMKCFGNIIVQ